jgi:D-alanyl-lipoteichoic acid acyltransferase DltB (MBOAT superfamily)
MLPQFANDVLYKLKASHLAVGITIFILGLSKKVILADNISAYATPVFEAAESDISLTIFEAWGGALAYTFQLYFDFSGYSDMAVGIARMFGVVLPINFYSPYKANSIIEFWHRWHITLSRFLRDYLYFPLGGNRKGKFRRYINLMTTMLLGGLWHGAGWTFIIWGGLHGLYLCVNHGWKAIENELFKKESDTSILPKAFGRLITFVAVVVAWVMFRAESLDGAINMYAGMFGGNGVSLPTSLEPVLTSLSEPLSTLGVNYDGMFKNNVFGSPKHGLLMLLAMLLIVWFAPNTYDWLKREKPALGLDDYLLVNKTSRLAIWKYNVVFAFVLALITVVCVISMSSPSEFLYFQF